MSDLVRVSISLERSLLESLDSLAASAAYANRSEFLRDLIRARLVEQEWERDEEAMGTLTLVYDHHARRLSERLVELQHEHHDQVMATTHVHLDHHLCAEAILLRGQASQLRTLADRIKQEKGVLHAELSMSSTGKRLS